MHVTDLPPDDRTCELHAVVDDAPVATLKITLLAPRLLHLHLDAPDATYGDSAAGAFADAITARWAGTDMELLAWERDGKAPMVDALRPNGWDVLRRKAFVECDLRATLPPAPAGLRRVALAAAGEAAFIGRLTHAAEGDPFADPEGDPQSEWNDLVRYAGELFDPERWYLVDDARGPVGVLLPQAYDATTGSIFYVAVLPARRGEGLGTALHAAGLRDLADRGLARYVGSTDVRNAAMLRVFARNGCPVTKQQVFLGSTPRP